MLFIRNQVLDHHQDDDAAEGNAQHNLAVFRLTIVNDMILDEENDTIEPDRRALLSTAVDMTRTEFDLLLTLARVYDHARSHFVFEICEPSTKRFLNAMQTRHEEDGERMPWNAYKMALLEQMQNFSTIDGLIDLLYPQAARQQLSHRPVGRGKDSRATIAERGWHRDVRRHLA
jgi:hypothetical protein